MEFAKTFRHLKKCGVFFRDMRKKGAGKDMKTGR